MRTLIPLAFTCHVCTSLYSCPPFPKPSPEGRAVGAGLGGGGWEPDPWLQAGGAGDISHTSGLRTSGGKQLQTGCRCPKGFMPSLGYLLWLRLLAWSPLLGGGASTGSQGEALDILQYTGTSSFPPLTTQRGRLSLEMASPPPSKNLLQNFLCHTLPFCSLPANRKKVIPLENPPLPLYAAKCFWERGSPMLVIMWVQR